MEKELNTHDRQVCTAAVEAYKAGLAADAADAGTLATEDAINTALNLFNAVEGQPFNSTIEQLAFNRELELDEVTDFGTISLADMSTHLDNLERLNTSDSRALASGIRNSLASQASQETF